MSGFGKTKARHLSVRAPKQFAATANFRQGVGGGDGEKPAREPEDTDQFVTSDA